MSSLTLKQAARVATANIKLDIPTLLLGAPGLGKSALCSQIALNLNMRLVDFRALLRDPIDLRGLPVPDLASKQTTWLRPDDLPFLPYSGDPCLIFMDEINTAPLAMQNACLGLVLERRVGQHVLHADSRIIAAGNRQEDRAGVNRMSSALVSRFAQYTVESDLDSFAQWYIKTDLPPVVLAFLRFKPDALHDMTPSKNGKWSDPRAWEKVAKIIASNPTDDLRPILVPGIVGDGHAADFEAFHQMFHKAPRIADIIANPSGVSVPNEPGILYAVSGALARATTRTNAGNVFKYAARMPKPFEVCMVTDAIGRDADLQATGAFTQWAIENPDITL
jgi:MoxR-like ATPase